MFNFNIIKMKNITKHIKKLNLFILAVTLFSCGEDFLSPAPTSVLIADTYFASEADLEAALVNMYDGIQGENSTSNGDNHALQVEFYLTEMRSDNTRTKSSEGEAAQFENYSVVATNGIVSDYYRSFYNVIFRANTVLAHLDIATDANRAKIEGEAKFVRAYAYFNLVRLYGDIPLIDRVLEITDPNYNSLAYTRVDKATVYELIESDLLTAIDGLDNTYVSRASLAAAQTLLAKVYLTLGTNYLDAQLLCEAVMGSGFTLEPNFKDVFYTELNNELIFSIGYIGDSSQDSQNFSAEWLNAVGRTSGVNYTTEDVRTVIDALGGDRKPYSYRVDTEQPSQFQVAKYIPDGDATLDISPTSTDPTSAGNDWIVLRYADVLLMHVESIMAGTSSTSVQAALDSFELVRLRAGLLADDDNNITKQELLDERRVELAFENQRFFDLVRFNEAQNVLSAFSTATGGTFNASDLLLPIPQREINLSNGLLSQNPGY